MKLVSEIMEPVNGESFREKDWPYALKRECVFYPGIYPYVQEIARFELISVNAADPVEKALETMLNGKVSSVPVFEKGKVVGIVRAGNLLALLDDPCEKSPAGYQA